MNQKVMVVSIVDNHYGSKIMKRIQKECASASFVFYGKGTVSNSIMNMLGIYDQKKEICINVIDKESEDLVYSTLETKLKIEKAGHGVLFTIPLRGINDKEEHMSSKEVIFVVVDNGKSEAVVESANQAGAQGGTIIHARGNAPVDAKKLFNMDIEPEQEVVLIVADKSKGTTITDAITKDLKLEEENNGHLFVLDVTRTAGFHKGHVQ